MFYALDSRNTDVLCTARANQGRQKQPAGLGNFDFFRHFFENLRTSSGSSSSSSGSSGSSKYNI